MNTAVGKQHVSSNKSPWICYKEICGGKWRLENGGRNIQYAHWLNLLSLDYIHRLIFRIKHDVSETAFIKKVDGEQSPNKEYHIPSSKATQSWSKLFDVVSERQICTIRITHLSLHTLLLHIENGDKTNAFRWTMRSDWIKGWCPPPPNQMYMEIVQYTAQ
jgi:hypothetical protein